MSPIWTRMKNTKVAVDLDGVIWDLVTPWLEEYNKIYADKILYSDITDYDVSKSMRKASREQLLNILARDEFWDLVEPFPGSVTDLEKLNNICELYVATKTDYRESTRKIRKLLSLFPYLEASQVICISNKSLLNVDYLVDDCVENLDTGSFNKIVFDAPYNRECSYPRAYNFKDVVNIIYEELNI